MRKVLAAALLCSPLLASASTVNLLSNGSFEADHQASGTWSTYSSLTGWTAGNKGVELRDNVAGTAEDGSNYIELDTTGNSSISQTISTIIGQWYELSFWYSNRTGTTVNTNGLTWSLGSSSGTVDKLAANNSGDNEWTLFTTLVQATGTSMTLTLRATGASDSVGTSVDNVSITAVPEPASLALVGIGLCALGLLRRRKS